MGKRIEAAGTNCFPEEQSTPKIYFREYCPSFAGRRIMSSGELHIAEQIMHKRLAERRQEIANRHQKRRARAHQPSWLSLQGRRLLCQLGYLLIALGKRLQRYELPPALPVKG
jgi:hypothetical protein